MNAEWVREFCLSLPGATENVIWGNDLTFKVAGKIFAHTVLEPAPVWLSFKVTAENFYALTERQNIVPAPYLARAMWIALQTRDALTPPELAALLRESHQLVVVKLPKKTQQALLVTSTRPENGRVPQPKPAERSAKAPPKADQRPAHKKKKRRH